MSSTDSGLGVWLYAVGSDADEAWLHDVRGVDGEIVREVSSAGLTALVGTVSLLRFGAEALRERLNNLDQLEDIARSHHEVIRIAAVSRPAAPARLATIYDDDGNVTEALRSYVDDFNAAVRRVAGCQEWGVKAFATPGPAEADAPAERPSSGAAYLRQRRAALEAEQVSRKEVAFEAEEVHDHLASLAVGAQLHRPQDRSLSGDDRWMVLNGAYLVDEREADEFRAAVAELADDHEHLDLALTGPWPPYSFAVIERDDGDPP